MSVINKMLRDLDRRNIAGASQAQNQAAHAGVSSGMQSVNDSDKGGKRGGARRRIFQISAVMALGAAGAMVWLLKPASNIALPATQSLSLPAPQAVAVTAVANTPVRAVSKPPKKIEVIVAAKTPPPPVKVMHNVAKLPDLPLIAGPVDGSLITPTAPRSFAEPLHKPALNALAQAQSLWNSGSRATAIDFLRDALVVTELAEKPSGNHSEMAVLARELARMELAEGRTSQALVMLTRLEPLLSGFADVWAIRGNAAQRLGRHEESAAAYLMALKLRPDEPRWMLGAAVSLAAQGQITNAAELAEKARVAGVLSPDVATYLQQLGVPLREH